MRARIQRIALLLIIAVSSSDLWVAGSVNNAKDTGKKSGVTYAVGAVEGALACSSATFPPLTHPQGPIKIAELEFAGFTIPDQAYSACIPPLIDRA